MSTCDRLAFSPSKAMHAQRILQERVVLKAPFEPGLERIVVGLDVAYKRLDGEYAYGVALVYDVVGNRVLDCLVATRRVCIPYVPGLLAFREMTVLGPLALRVRKLWEPDVYLVDGHGISHPRRFGIATHIGVVIGRPSIGVAKKKLAGRVVGDYVIIDGEPVARIVRTPTGSAIYVSPGNLMSLEAAYIIVKRLLRGRLPEPLLIADVQSKASKKLIRPTEKLTYHKCPTLLGFSA